ncbi:MAG: hypothetical protein WCT46_02340 [Candidatus Gracilibacteria bacterium]|jgi:hypothetical protein
MIKKLLTIILAILTLSALAGCQSEVIEKTATYQDEQIASISALHPDIYMPTDTTWTRSIYSGEVEQYELASTKDPAVFGEEAKSFMTNSGWELYEEKNDNNLLLRFKKGDWLVAYSLQVNGSLTLFVEPKSLYE